MLQQFRGALKGVFAWLIFSVLILAFAIWGIGDVVTGVPTGAPLTVGKQAVTQQQLTNEFERQLTSRRQQQEGYTRQDAIEQGLPVRVVQDYANRLAIEQAARRLGVTATSKMVRDYLSSEEGLQNPATGKFDEQILDAILRQNNFTPAQFRAVIRADMIRSQLIDAVSAGGPAPSEMTLPLLKRSNERREVRYLLITQDMAGQPEAPTDDALQEYYDQHTATFSTPELRTFSVVQLTPAEFEQKLTAPEDQIRKLYDMNKDAYSKPERRTIRQLTFDSESAANAAAARLKAGEDFGAIAKERGLTVEAATLDEVTQNGVANPQFAAAAFAAQPGDVIAPVKGLFGWTLGKLVSVTPPEVTPFEEVKPELEKQFLERDAQKAMLDTLETFESARDGGASIVEAAKEAKLTLTTYGPLTREGAAPDGEAIDPPPPPQALEQAFRLGDGEESDVEDLDGGGYFALSIDSETPMTPIPFEQVKDKVRDAWLSEAREKKLRAAVRDIRAQVDAGKTFDAAADAYGRTPVTRMLTRQSTDETFGAQLLEKIFRAPMNEMVSGAAASGQAQVIVETSMIAYPPTPPAVAQLSQVGQIIGYNVNAEMMDAYVRGVRDELGVKVNEKLLAAAFPDAEGSFAALSGGR